MGGELDIKAGLRIGNRELDFLQDSGNSRIKEFFQAVISRPGICLQITASGHLSRDCEVTTGTGFSVIVTAGKLIDSLGRVIDIEDDIELDVPSGGPYLVLAKYSTTYQESGSVAVQYDAGETLAYRNKITGTDTSFTEYLRVGMYVKISGSSEGNNGTYRIVQINSDTDIRVELYDDTDVLHHFTTTEESDLDIEVSGDYATGYPGDGDKRIYKYDSATVFVRLESSGYTDGEEFPLARVSRNASGSVTIADLRGESILTLRPSELLAEIDEYFEAIPPAYIRLTTGTIELDTASPADGFTRDHEITELGTSTLRNSYLKLEWGWHCEAENSDIVYEIATGYTKLFDESLASSTWDDNFWVNKKHYLIDSNNVLHKIVASGGNWVAVETEPADGEFWITPNAESYNVIVTEITESGDHIGTMHEETVSRASSPVSMEFRTFDCLSGHRYKVSVCSLKNGMRSEYKVGSPATIVAGDVGVPTVTPTCSLAHPLAMTSSGEMREHLGIVHLRITNYTDCITGTGGVAASGFEIFVKQSSSETDYPDMNDDYYWGTIHGATVTLTTRHITGTGDYLNVRVRAVSASGQRGSAWSGSTSATLYATITEEASEEDLGGYTIMSLLSLLAGFASGSDGGSGVLSERVTNIVNAICIDMCCDGDSSCSISSSSADSSEYFNDQHYINVFAKGTIPADKTIFRTRLGRRYAIYANKFRLKNEDAGTGVSNVKVEGGSTSAELALPSGDYIYENPAFPAIAKTQDEYITIRSITGLRDPHFRLGFKISDFGVFNESGTELDVHEETLFYHMGELTEGQEIELEEGTDYPNTFTVKGINPSVQMPPTGGDLVIRIGNMVGGASDYLEFTIPEGETMPTDTSNFFEELRVEDPKQLYCHIESDSYGSAYLQVDAQIQGKTTASGVYPYDYPPHWKTFFYQGEHLEDTRVKMARLLDTVEIVWFEVHLPSPATEDVTFRIYGSSLSDFCDITIPEGSYRNDQTDSVRVTGGSLLKIEVISGAASYYTVLYEMHKT